MNTLLEQVNSAGKAFVEFGWPMLIQSSLLISILLLADLLLRKKVWAVFRYWIWQAVVFLVWVVAVLALGLLLIQRAAFVCGLVRQSAEANGLMNDTLRFCCKQMGVKGRINLRVSANATSPAVCGLFQPVILIPANLGSTLGAEHLRTVLLHELAHIKRGDLWVNLALQRDISSRIKGLQVDNFL